MKMQQNKKLHKTRSTQKILKHNLHDSVYISDSNLGTENIQFKYSIDEVKVVPEEKSVILWAWLKSVHNICKIYIRYLYISQNVRRSVISVGFLFNVCNISVSNHPIILETFVSLFDRHYVCRASVGKKTFITEIFKPVSICRDAMRQLIFFYIHACILIHSYW